MIPWHVLGFCTAVILGAAVLVLVALSVIDSHAWDVDPEWRAMVRRERAEERAERGRVR